MKDYLNFWVVQFRSKCLEIFGNHSIHLFCPYPEDLPFMNGSVIMMGIDENRSVFAVNLHSSSAPLVYGCEVFQF